MKTNVIASLEEIRLRTEFAPVERNGAATFQQRAHVVLPRSMPMDADDNCPASGRVRAHGMTSTY